MCTTCLSKQVMKKYFEFNEDLHLLFVNFRQIHDKHKLTIERIMITRNTKEVHKSNKNA